MRSLLLVAACLIVMSTAACTTFLGTFYRADPGQVIFGATLDPTMQMVAEKADTMIASEQGMFALTATFPSAVDLRNVRVVATRDGGPGFDPDGWPRTGTSDTYVSQYWRMDFPPGHYVFTVTDGSKPLASGELDITP